MWSQNLSPAGPPGRGDAQRVAAQAPSGKRRPYPRRAPPGFRGGVRGGGLNLHHRQSHSRPAPRRLAAQRCRPSDAAVHLRDPPPGLDSRIDSERRALATPLVRFYARLWKRPSEKLILALRYMSPLDTTTPASALL